jgi:hypothetical protein
MIYISCMSITPAQYIEYLIATPKNFTCTNLANHVQHTSHDSITDFLAGARVTARDLWQQVKPIINDTLNSYLIVDDSVQDKSYSTKIEIARYQWSSLEGRVIRGISMISLVHVQEDTQVFHPIDDRLYAPEQDGKTKNKHFRDMLLNAVVSKGIQARTVLFDAWYASVENFKFIQHLKLVFIAAIKSNRLVSISQNAGYVKPGALEWTPEMLEHGVEVKLRELPFKLRLFKLVAKNGDIDWIVTNDPASNLTVSVVQTKNAVRWRVEQLHRELKQLS